MATLACLAELVQGRIIGNPDLEISRVMPIDQAGKGDITFVANPKYLSRLSESQASAVIVSPGVEAPQSDLIITANPYLAFARILTYLQGDDPPPRGIMAGAQVAASAVVAATATLYPGCIVGERVCVGAGSVLYPGVCLYDDVVIGSDCRLHAHVVVREGCRLGDRVIL